MSMNTERSGEPRQGSLSDHDGTLRSFYAAMTAERTAPAPRPSGYTELGVTKAVRMWAGYAMDCGGIVLLEGPSGAGKTYALENFCLENDKAWFVEMSPAVCTPAAVLSTIAAALHLGDVSGGPVPVQRAIERRFLRDCSLLVVDEAHHLSEAALDQVRCIRGDARCGLVLAGNPPLWTRVASGKRTALFSRLDHAELLKPASEEDAIALAQTLAGRDLGAKGRDAAVVASRGAAGFRGVVKMMKVAGVLARGAGRSEVGDGDIASAAGRMKRSPMGDG